MKNTSTLRKLFFGVCVLTLIATLVILIPAGSTLAADPETGTLDDGTSELTFTSGPHTIPTGDTCEASVAGTCDNYALVVDFGTDMSATHEIEIAITWPVVAADFDLVVYDSNDNEIAASEGFAQFETVTISAANGTYRVEVNPFAPGGQTVTGMITLVEDDGGGNGSTGPLPANFPRYYNYTPPANMGQGAGEPTLGVNHNTNATMYVAGLETLRIHFDDVGDPAPEDDSVETEGNIICSSPVTEQWIDKSYVAHVNTLDPILDVEPVTGRTISSQLAPKTSVIGVSTDDGETWLPSEGADVGVSGVDHQTVGQGPFRPGLTEPVHPLSETAVYYCGQDIAYANCARSDDGGITFNPAIITHNLTECGGLHGHINISPLNADGTPNDNTGIVYLPNKGCGGEQAVIVSEDNGLTWDIRTVPGSAGSSTDPAVALGEDGTVYFAYIDGNSTPTVATSTDRGNTWTVREAAANLETPVNTGVFATVIAGDSDRAAFAFIGTNEVGHTSSNEATVKTDGEWFLYVSHTFDHGDSWHAINLTPDRPVQRGSICTAGTTCPGDRNLLDFMDITVDVDGRALVGYADGCVDDCEFAAPNSFSDRGAIARQEGGMRLYAAKDAEIDFAMPSAPRVEKAERQPGTGFVFVEWTDFNAVADIDGYNVYRSDDGGAFVKLNSSPINSQKSRYIDATAPKETQDEITGEITTHTYHYQVTAVKGANESQACQSHPVTDLVDDGGLALCILPGVQLVPEPNDAKTTHLDAYDIVSVAISEPYDETNPTVNKLAVTMQTQKTNAAQPFTPFPDSRYGYQFDFDGTTYFVELDTTIGNTFQYGTIDGGTRTVVGNFDNDSNIQDNGNDTGSIQLIITSDLVGNPTAGDTLENVIVYARANTTAEFGDVTDAISYEVRASNVYCAPNTPPRAVLTSPNGIEGTGPFEYTASGVNSFDEDAGDTIVQYIYVWGDGETTETTASSATHTYTTDGEYLVQLVVKDSREKFNINAAQQVIEVTGTPTALTFGEMNADGMSALWGVAVIVALVGMSMGVVVMRRKAIS